MSLACPTCRSERCGNHAGGARRAERTQRWWFEWRVEWGLISAAAFLDGRRKQRLGKAESLRELERVQRETPDVFHVLAEVTRKIAMTYGVAQRAGLR